MSVAPSPGPLLAKGAGFGVIKFERPNCATAVIFSACLRGPGSGVSDEDLARPRSSCCCSALRNTSVTLWDGGL